MNDPDTLFALPLLYAQAVAGQGRLFEDEGAVRDWEGFLKSVAMVK